MGAKPPGRGLERCVLIPRTMKKLTDKKLKLASEKIRDLDVKDMKDVVGGVSRSCKMSELDDIK